MSIKEWQKKKPLIVNKYELKQEHMYFMVTMHSVFSGPLSDIIQLLLTALFSMQEEEDDEILETDNQTSGVCEAQ
jgi:hypothetical protein